MIKMTNTWGLLVAAVAIFQLCGCSVIGYSIGKVIDDSKPNRVTLKVEKVKTLELGTQINIILNDGDKLSGEYSGLKRVTTDEYAESYAKSREQNQKEVILPALGDSITITRTIRPLYFGFLSFGKKLTAEFLGFDYEAILVRRTGENPSKVALSNVREIMDSNKNAVEVETLRKLMSESKIPLLSAIVVQSERERMLVSIDSV